MRHTTLQENIENRLRSFQRFPKAALSYRLDDSRWAKTASAQYLHNSTSYNSTSVLSYCVPHPFHVF